MGQDMVTAAMLITCVGCDSQAVSRGSVAGYLASTHNARCRAKRGRRDEQAREREREREALRRSFRRSRHSGAAVQCGSKRARPTAVQAGDCCSSSQDTLIGT